VGIRCQDGRVADGRADSGRGQPARADLGSWQVAPAGPHEPDLGFPARPRNGSTWPREAGSGWVPRAWWAFSADCVMRAARCGPRATGHGRAPGSRVGVLCESVCAAGGSRMRSGPGWRLWSGSRPVPARFTRPGRTSPSPMLLPPPPPRPAAEGLRRGEMSSSRPGRRESEGRRDICMIVPVAGWPAECKRWCS
jgi:hypothetical protein